VDLHAQRTLATQGSWTRRTLIGIGIATIVASGTVVAVAGLASTTPSTGPVAPNTMNVDSLYTALAADEEQVIDSSSAMELQPQKTLNGHASWYGPGFHGRKTASGERFDRNEMSAAHKTLPFGTLVRVIDEKTGKSVLVKINDRGPYVRGRLLDLSEAAAQRLGIRGRGTGNVRLEIFSPKEFPANMTFDDNGRARVMRGFSVRVARTNEFDEAIALQHRLADAGHDDVLLTRSVIDGRTEYQVSIGLFSTERLCQSLLAELVDDFRGAALVRFDDGLPVEQTLAGS
jgi:rare lipoprotein A